MYKIRKETNRTKDQDFHKYSRPQIKNKTSEKSPSTFQRSGGTWNIPYHMQEQRDARTHFTRLITRLSVPTLFSLVINDLEFTRASILINNQCVLLTENLLV